LFVDLINDEIFRLQPDNVSISEFRELRLYFNYLVITPADDEGYFDIQKDLSSNLLILF
jgi:hypothetical protein